MSTKIASKISKVQEKQEAQHERSSKKPQVEEMSKSGVAPKSSLKPNESKSNLIKSAVVEKEKKEEEKAPSLETFDEPFFDEALQTLIGLGFPEE